MQQTDDELRARLGMVPWRIRLIFTDFLQIQTSRIGSFNGRYRI